MTTGSRAKSMLSIIRNHQARRAGLYHFAFSSAMNERSCCSTSMIAFGVFGVLDFGHSNRWIVISGCICISLMTHDMEHLYVCLFPSVYLFQWDVCWGFNPFFKSGGLFSCYSALRVLCVFWITVHYHLCFCKYFLPVCDLSSNSFDIVFHRTEVFNFDEVVFVNYFFYESCLCCCI